MSFPPYARYHLLLASFQYWEEARAEKKEKESQKKKKSPERQTGG